MISARCKKVAAEFEGVDIQVQRTDRLVRHMVQVQHILELTAFAEQSVAEHAIGALRRRARHGRQDNVVVVDQPGTDHGGRMKQAHGELLCELGVDVVGDARSGVMTDLQQGANFTIDGGVFAGIIDRNLDEAEQGSQQEADQNRHTGLFERQSVCDWYIHKGI